jgi:hypothetical protein
MVRFFGMLIFVPTLAMGQSSLPPCPPSGKWTNCFGEIKLNNGRYVGEFADGKRSGQGTYFYENGDKYVGEWQEGQRTGKGTFNFASGAKHVGEFKEGKRNGQGIEYLSNGSVRRSGTWTDDRFNEPKVEVSTAEVKTEAKKPPEVKRTYAQTRGFAGQPFLNIDDRVELLGACTAATTAFMSEARGTSYDTRGAATWTACISRLASTETNYKSSISKWTKIIKDDLKSAPGHPASYLQIYSEQCMRGFPVMVTHDGRCPG